MRQRAGTVMHERQCTAHREQHDQAVGGREGRDGRPHWGTRVVTAAVLDARCCCRHSCRRVPCSKAPCAQEHCPSGYRSGAGERGTRGMVSCCCWSQLFLVVDPPLTQPFPSPHSHPHPHPHPHPHTMHAPNKVAAEATTQQCDWRQQRLDMASSGPSSHAWHKPTTGRRWGWRK
jgi:hypothetical protein